MSRMLSWISGTVYRLRRRRCLSYLALVSIAASISFADGSAAVQASDGPFQVDTQQPRFESRVDLVMLPVSVLDSDRLPVEGLTPGDFLVLEDEAEQEVALLLSPDEAPLDIVLLMDVSSSMWSMEEAAKTSAIAFLDQLSYDDCVLLLRFRETPEPGIWGLPSDPGIRRAVNETSLEGGTALRDGIAMGFQRLDHDLDRCWVSTPLSESNQGAPRSRPAMVVVSDGLDEHSAISYDRLLNIARQAEAPFFPVGFGQITLPASLLRKAQADAVFDGRVTRREERQRSADGGSAWASRSLSELQGLARVTGGQFIKGGSNQEKLTAAYAEVLRWLRSYYLVGYYPNAQDAAQGVSELPAWHNVEVRLRRPGYQINARTGYYHMPIDVIAAERHIQEGVDLITEGEATEALTELGKALRADPFSWEAHYYHGEAFVLAGKTKDAQQALLRAAELGPGQGDVHELACRVSLELGDYETAWDQAIRAQQAEINMTEELLMLREESAAPADLEERLQAPSFYIESFGATDPTTEAALRILHLTLAQALSESPEVGLIDLGALADYRILIKMKKLSERSPRRLEADIEVWESESTGGDRVYRRGVTLADIENREAVAAELAPHITEMFERLSG
jgi:VWFA-related protein